VERSVVVGAVIALILAACTSSDPAPSGDSAPSSSTTTSSVVTTTSTVPSTTTTSRVTTTTESAEPKIEWPCATWPCEDSVRNDRWPQSPDIWHPDFTPYVTNDPEIQISVYAAADSTVAVNSIAAEPVQDWANDKAMFWATINLDVGSNTLIVTIDNAATELIVNRDPSLERAYGRVLDTWTYGELGIDFGEMDFEPDYGQGDFFPGAVDVDSKQLDRNVVLIHKPERGWDWPIAIRGEETVWNFFTYGEARNHDVWDILLDGDTIIQIEGPIPLGE